MTERLLSQARGSAQDKGNGLSQQRRPKFDPL